MSERRYLAPLPLGGDEGPPWSKGLMARALAATGLTPTRAYELARARRRGHDRSGARSSSISTGSPRSPSEVLGEPEAGRTMRRLRRLQALQHLELPVLLLVGGATGTGKSTLATEAAHRLGITRVTSTDFIRQTMRAFFSREFMPSVHYSSFEAELGLSRADEDLAGDAALLGFLDQTRNVLVGVEAAIDRALTEGWSMVLEGVHIVPGMISRRPGRRARRAVRRRDQRRGRAPQPLLGARRGDRRPAPAREVPRGDDRDPDDPGRPARARPPLRRAGDREHVASTTRSARCSTSC